MQAPAHSWWQRLPGWLTGNAADAVTGAVALPGADERERTPAFLLELGDALRDLDDPVAVMETATALLGAHLGADQVAYAEIDPDGVHATIERAWNGGSMPDNSGRYRLACLGVAFIAEMKRGAAIAIDDVARDPRTASAETLASFRSASIAAFLGVPLVKAGRLAAVLAVHQRMPRAWSWGDLAAARETAERTWGAVVRAQAERALRASEERLRLASEAAGFGIYDVDVARQRILRSPGLLRILGRGGEAGAVPFAAMLADVHPADRDRVGAEMAAAFARPGHHEREFRVLRPGGAVRWVLDCGETFAPVDPATGRVRRGAGMLIDITDRKLGEQALRRSNDSYLSLIQSNPFGIYLVDSQFRLAEVSAGAQKVFSNVSPLIGRDFAEVLRCIWAEPFASEAIGRFRHTLATGEPYRAPDTIEQRNDVAETECYDWRIERVTLPDGTVGVVCFFYDMTERKRYEERIRLLMGEVNHRAKNMLALVQAVARQTAASGTRNFIESFEERIQALAASQDLLVDSEWRGVALDELVRSQLAPFEPLIGRRIAMRGPPLRIAAAAAQTLGMAVHELVTNASKHGALSDERGRIDIDWTLSGDDEAGRSFALTWRERDGPVVTPPGRRGFGSTVLGAMAKGHLQADIEVDYAPEGLRWHLSCAAAGILDPTG